MADRVAGGRNRWDKRGPENETAGAVATEAVTSSNGGENSKRTAEKRAADESEEDTVAQPAAPKLSKFGFAVGGQAAKVQPVQPVQPVKAPAAKLQAGISIKLAATKAKEATPVVTKVRTVASVFNEDDSEPEEMPPEAKMRMKNIGRETPTSAGPNSFNKGKHGFSDNQKLWERNIKSRLGDNRHHNDHD